MKNYTIQEIQQEIISENYKSEILINSLDYFESWRKNIIDTSISLVAVLLILPFIFLININIPKFEIYFFISGVIFIALIWNCYRDVRRRNIKKRVIHFWVQGSNKAQFSLLIKYFIQYNMADGLTYVASYFIESTSSQQMEYFPLFWDEIYKFSLVERFYKKFLCVFDLIPSHYHASFQTSTVTYPAVYVSFYKINYRENQYQKVRPLFKGNIYKSPLIERCIRAEFFINYQLSAEMPEEYRLTCYYQELKMILLRVDPEMSTFLQIWNDTHLNINIRYILSEIHSILIEHSNSQEDPTIYHLLIKYAKNKYLRSIAIDMALENVPHFQVELDQLPSAIINVSKFIQRFDKPIIEKMPPWEKISIHWLTLLIRRQQFEFPQMNRLYCKSCYLFGEIIETNTFQGNVSYTNQQDICTVCIECEETKSLEYVPGLVVGVLSDNFFSQKKYPDIHIGVWDEKNKKFQSAIFEKLCIIPKLNIDYDWAIVAILSQLPKRDKNNQAIRFEIPSNIVLKENTQRVLKDFHNEGYIQIVNVD